MSATAGSQAWFGEQAADPEHEVERLRAVLGHCPRCIAVLDASGRLDGFNAPFARLFDVVPPLGAPLTELLDASDQALLEHVIRSVRKEDKSAALLRLATRNGRDVEFLAATLPSKDGEIVGVVLAGEDCTERRRDEYDEANHAVDLAMRSSSTAFDLAQATLAHDLANALEIAILNVQSVARAVGNTEPIRDASDALARATELLNAVKQRGARAPAVRERSDVGACATRVERLLRKTLPRRTVTLVCEVMPDIYVPLSASELAQIVTNLLSNAIHSIEDAGRPGLVRLTVARADERVFLRVRDDGVGIAPSRLRSIFKPHETSRAAAGGTGLGLPIVKRLVESAGGCIRVVSEPGGGTEFTIELPADEEMTSELRLAASAQRGAAANDDER